MFSITKKVLLEKEQDVKGLAACRSYIDSLLRWHYMRVKGRSLQDFLRKRNIRSFSIYGYGEVGKILIMEVKPMINYVIVKEQAMVDKLDLSIKVTVPCRRNDYGDAIIITILHEADREVKQELENLCLGIPIVLMRDIITSETM